MKKILSVFLCITLILCFAPLCFATADDSTSLRFNEDGSFKILVLADCQDDKNPDADMMEAITQLLVITNPDLVVFTGDNVLENNISEFTQGLTALLNPVISANIPYAFTFGNHDDEYGVSKEDQFTVYKSLGNCLTTDPDPSLTGLGTCNIPILSSNNDSMAFNLWIVDSNTYDKTNGGYDNVHADQLDWLKIKQTEITKAEGRVVNSIVFQHIIVPEVTQCLEQSTEGFWSYGGNKYNLVLNDKASGTIFEHPCPPTVNSGEYTTLEELGGVLGVVSGHDHTNDFIAKPGSVDLIQVGGMSYSSYGNDAVRGASLITLNENDTDTYTIQRYLNTKLFAGDYGYVPEGPVYTQIADGITYISEVAIGNDKSSGGTAKAQLTDDGYTVIDFDLNKNAGGDYIYLGYKTTTDVNQAITSLRVTSSTSSGYSNTKEYRGKTYSLASDVDLNKDAGGHYIYLYYTKQAGTGAPITGLSVNETASTEGFTAVGSFTDNAAADINKKAGGAYVYIQMASDVPVLNADNFIDAYKKAVNADTTGKATERIADLNNAINNAGTVYNELKNTFRTTASQSDIDAKTEALTTALYNLGCENVHISGAAVKENKNPATCTTLGSYDEVVYCTLCQKEISRTTVFTEKGNHIDSDGDSICDNCGEKLSDDCSHLCHKSGFLGFIWKMVNLFNKLFKINQYCSCGKAHW